MGETGRESTGKQSGSWRSLTTRERALLGFLGGAIGVLSGVAQFLGTYIDNGLALFGVSLLVVCAVSAIVMAIMRYRRAALFTTAFLVAIVLGGIAGYLVGPGDGGSPQSQSAHSTSPSAAASGPASYTPSPQPSTGSPRPLQISAKADGARTVVVDVVRRRAPAAGRSFWLVIRVYGVNGHSEFYPSKDLSTVPQSYSYEISLPEAANMKLRRTGRVYEVDSATAKRFKADTEEDRTIPIDELTKPPCDDCAASAEIELPLTE